METDDKSNLTVVVVQENKDKEVISHSLPTQDIGIASNLQAIIGSENSYLIISNEDDPRKETK